MPLILKDIENEKYSFGIWQVSEDYHGLLSMVNLNKEDIATLNEFQNPPRKLEWLSVRTCLRSLLNNDTGIYYNGRRKPFLRDHSHNISISHSHQLSSVMISRGHRVGIDLEYMSHRISKISHRFMHDDEYITSQPDLQFYHLYIHWCAKEALYKICDKEGLNFKTNLILGPFEPEEKGVISGSVIRDDHQEGFLLNYFKFENYIIVYCLK